jgi:AcrR family transcriptional regulator
MPKGIPLTPEEQARRRHEIFEASIKLFIERGFPETSMREVAKAVGIGKSTLYDYFRTKDEILVWGMEDIVADLTVMARETAALPLPAADRLRKVMRDHVAELDSRKDFYLRLSFEVQRLSLQAQKRIQVRRHEYQDLVAQLVATARGPDVDRGDDANHLHLAPQRHTAPNARGNAGYRFERPTGLGHYPHLLAGRSQTA